MLIDIRISPRELNTLLGALRLLQEEIQRNPARCALDTPLGNILTNGGEDAGPGLREIDDLCHRLNCV